MIFLIIFSVYISRYFIKVSINYNYYDISSYYEKYYSCMLLYHNKYSKINNFKFILIFFFFVANTEIKMEIGNYNRN